MTPSQAERSLATRGMRPQCRRIGDPELFDGRMNTCGETEEVTYLSFILFSAQILHWKERFDFDLFFILKSFNNSNLHLQRIVQNALEV